MALIIGEDKTLNKKRFTLTEPLRDHLRDTLGKYYQQSNEKGYKRLNALLFPDYNKRAEGGDGKSISFTDAKRIQHDMNSMNRKGLQYALNGGDMMKNAVDGFMSTARNANKEVEAVKPVKPSSRQLKVKKTTDGSLKPSKEGLVVHESIRMKITESQLLALKRLANYL